jgi:hypothetical protein
MLHKDNKIHPRAFDLAIQFLYWVARSLVAMILMTALSLGLILFSAWAATAQTSAATSQCVTRHLFIPGPIVDGHHRQPTEAEIEERTRGLWASNASAGACR